MRSEPPVLQLLAILGLLLLVACGSADDLRWAWTGNRATVTDVVDVPDPGIFDEGTMVEDSVDLDISPETCFPACVGKECGDDGCGGSCGTCPGGKICVDGQCEVLVTDGFVSISAGSFWMGSPSAEDEANGCPEGYPGVCVAELGRGNDEDLHYVKLTHPFEMQAHEVTQGEFEAVMGWNPSYFGPNGIGGECGANCPVEKVSWYAAAAYANEMSKSVSPAFTTCYVFADVECVDGTTHGSDYMACMNATQGGIESTTVTLNEVGTPYECIGYRLPTEAEWEYAARAGTDTAFHKSPGNDGTITYSEKEPLDPNLDQIGWYGGNSAATYSGYDCSKWFSGATNCGTQPVGGKELNEWNLYDMSGNLMEWLWDEHVSYPEGTKSDPGIDPVGSGNSNRLRRGGSWYSEARFCRSAFRHSYSPAKRGFYLGFRLSRTLGESSCIPDCMDKECGSDGCGGSCGSCGEGGTCQDGMCIYTPTWTDPSSGLTWQNPPYDGNKDWEEAKQYCADLSLAGEGWHLPAIGELRTLIRGCPATEDGGICNIEGGDCLSKSCRDDSCGGCSFENGPGEGGMYWPDEIQGDCCWYWSSSPVDDYGYYGWLVSFSYGGVYGYAYNAVHVRCVR